MMQLTPFHLSTAIAIVLASSTACATFNRVVNPAAAQEAEWAEKQQKEDDELRARTKDGECDTAEVCKYRCEHLKRAEDCYRTGRAAMHGRTVDYKAKWKYEAVQGGSNPDHAWVHHEGSSEHESMYPLARQAFADSCRAGKLESCQRGHRLFAKGESEEFRATAKELLTKGCALGDAEMCNTLKARP
jgi:hypothetical protein